ncbi:MAG TPA: HutD family protein [Rhizobiaceae bacterium]|nr:HutD family protein [Rhizobiaceae bacterium]
MRVLRSAGHKKMPWKNGGGITTEIAVFPPDAGLDDFHWRVSTARVEQNGPFSIFPGVDRSLSLLDGDGITLKVEGSVPFGMTRRYEPLVFPADVPTEAVLMCGPITDLNVMTRRGSYESEVELVEVSGRLPLASADCVTILIAEGEGISVENGGGTVKLERGDAVVLGCGDAVTLSAKRRTYAIGVTILPVKQDRNGGA